MQLPANALLYLASHGRCTLQVPDAWLVETPPLTYPDEWFVQINCDAQRPAIGRERSLLFLSRAGFEANQAALRQAFETAVQNGYDRGAGRNTWDDFVRTAENLWAQWKHMLEVHANNLEEKLQAARALLQANPF